MWIIILLVGLYASKKSIKDSLTISSVVLLGTTSLVILLKLGLFEHSIVKYRNSRFNFKFKKKPEKKKITINDYNKLLKKRLWWPLLTNLFFYLIFLIIAILI